MRKICAGCVGGGGRGRGVVEQPSWQVAPAALSLKAPLSLLQRIWSRFVKLENFLFFTKRTKYAAYGFVI